MPGLLIAPSLQRLVRERPSSAEPIKPPSGSLPILSLSADQPQFRERPSFLHGAYGPQAARRHCAYDCPYALFSAPRTLRRKAALTEGSRLTRRKSQLDRSP
jgi:hypothetical protein